MPEQAWNRGHSCQFENLIIIPAREDNIPVLLSLVHSLDQGRVISLKFINKLVIYCRLQGPGGPSRAKLIINTRGEEYSCFVHFVSEVGSWTGKMSSNLINLINLWCVQGRRGPSWAFPIIPARGEEYSCFVTSLQLFGPGSGNQRNFIN